MMTVAVLGGAAVAMTVRPSDRSGASSPLCRDTSQRFLPRRFIPYVLFLPSPHLSLSVSQSIFPCFLVFLSFGRFSLYPVGFSLTVPPFSAVFSLFSTFFFFLFPPSVFCTWMVFIGAGGAGTTLPHPITVHGVRSRRSTLSQHRLRRPMGTSLAGHGLSVFSS